MFHQSDPRSALVPATGVPHGQGPYPSAEYVGFHEIQPSESDSTARTWYVRGQHFVVSYTEAVDATSLSRSDQLDEYMVLLPDRHAGARVHAEDVVKDVDGAHLVVVPPGASTITTFAPGRLVRIFTSRSPDLARRCANAASYATPHRYVGSFHPWPDPPGGFHLRTYDLNVPNQQARFGRIFRCTGLMINVLYPWLGPRDASRLSPHHHADFEQGMLALDGEYIQHHRWAWTPDRSEWREDQHMPVMSPSLLVIPPPAIHTTQAVGEGINRIVDIFSPPRIDFSERAGWVLNADDYPAPVR
jgi:hypothetical protein